MKKFWLMTHSATAAIGWVAIAQASGQAMEEAVVELDVPAPAPVVAAEPIAPVPVEVVPPAPAPAPEPAWTAPEPTWTAPEPTWTDPEPQPQTQTYYVDPEPVYSPEPAVLPDPEPTWETPTPSFSEPTNIPPTPTPPRFIEEDPVLQAVINPETPAQAAAVKQMRPEEVIRDGRSFAELLGPSSQTQTAPPQQFMPPPRPAAPPVATVETSNTVDSTLLLQQLERDLAQIRREVRRGLSTTALSPAPIPVLPDFQLDSLETQLALPTPEATEAIQLPAFQQTEFGAWDVAGLGATFTRNDFNVYTFSASFFDEDLYAVDWHSLGLDTFDSELLAQLEIPEWAIDFDDLSTQTDGFLADLELPLESEALPLTSFDASGELVLDFSALDAVAQQSPLGTNPLTFGHPADALTESVVAVVR